MYDRALSLLTLFLLLVVCFGVLPHYGMSWDEPTRWASGDQKLRFYESLFEPGKFRENIQSPPRDLYPGLFDIPLALLSQIFPIDRFLWGHAWSLFFGLAGLVGTWACAHHFTRERKENWLPTGLVAATSLLFIPTYFGHMFLNPKDIPFAATYVWAIFALLHFIGEFPRPRWKTTLFFGLAVGVCMSTRLPGGVGLLYAAMIALCWLVVGYFRGEGWATLTGNAISLLVRGVTAGMVAFLWLIPWWPAALRNPFLAPAEAVGALHTFSATIPVLFRGAVFEAGETPFYYALWMFFITMPEWLLLFLAIALAAGGQSFREINRRWMGGDSRIWKLYAVGLSVGFPLVYVTIMTPAIHNGFRHLLYILPPLAVMVSLGISRAGYIWLRSKRQRIGAYFALGVTVCMALVPLISLHPYQYIYYNILVGGTAGSYGRYETEYWFTSSRHALEWIDEQTQSDPASPDNSRQVFITGPHQVAQPFLPERTTLTTDPRSADIIVANTQMLVHTLFPGEILHVIERAGLPIVYIIDPRGQNPEPNEPLIPPPSP